MDPLPNVNKAYCMIARVKTQRNVTSSFVGSSREIASNVKSSFTSSPPLVNGECGSIALYANGGPNSRPKRDNKKPKGARFCDHCQRTGHTDDQCFKLVGYPDWYDDPRDTTKGRRSTKVVAHVASQPEPVA